METLLAEWALCVSCACTIELVCDRRLGSKSAVLVSLTQKYGADFDALDQFDGRVAPLVSATMKTDLLPAVNHGCAIGRSTATLESDSADSA